MKLVGWKWKWKKNLPNAERINCANVLTIFCAIVCIFGEYFCSEINQIPLEKILWQSCRIKKRTNGVMQNNLKLPFIYGNVFEKWRQIVSAFQNMDIHFSFRIIIRFIELYYRFLRKILFDRIDYISMEEVYSIF
jgi:hypothetical protein